VDLLDREDQRVPLHQPSHRPKHPTADDGHRDHDIGQPQLRVLAPLVALIGDEAGDDADEEEDGTADPERSAAVGVSHRGTRRRRRWSAEREAGKGEVEGGRRGLHFRSFYLQVVHVVFV